MENKIAYEKKDGISGFYIVFEIDSISEESVETKMLQNNEISGLLPCDFRYENNRIFLYYDTTDKIAISDIMKDGKLTYDILTEIYEAIANILKNCEKYLISANAILFRKDLIFGSRKYKKLKFCVLPGQNSSFRKQIRELTEDFMKISDHCNRECIEFIYGIYDIVSENNFYTNDIEEFINEHKISGEMSERQDVDILENNDYGVYVKSGDTVNNKVYDYDKNECFSLVRGKIQNNLIREFVPDVINIKKSLSVSDGLENIVNVGRGHDNEVVLPQNYISRKHAILEADENFLYVTDRGSCNGTFVNGEKIAANVKTKCRVQDEITFADICFKVV